MINIENPEDDVEYLISWTNKLDFSNCNMYLMKEENKNYIICSFKQIGINTFNVFVFDLETKLIKFWHESNQFWEMPIMGFLLDTHDFMILNKDGINIITIANRKSRDITDSEGQMRRIHSLGSMEYLKVEPSNHLLFACQNYNNRQVCI